MNAVAVLQKMRRRRRAIAAFLRVEVLHLLRDRTSLSLILAVPIIQIILFGYAVNLQPSETPIAISGVYGAEIARSVIADAGGFKIVAVEEDAGRATALVKSGSARIGIELPTSLLSPTLHMIVDDADLGASRAAALRLKFAYWRSKALSSGGSEREFRVDWLYNSEGRTNWAIAPGLIGVIVMISMLLLGALALVKERERGSWESITFSPAATSDAILGKLAPYVPIGLLQAMISLAASVALFQLPVRGDVPALLVLASLLSMFHLAVGFTMSALAQSQLQAVQMAVFFYLPNMLLSGFLFPFEAMPRWARQVGEVLPLTHFVRAARGICLKGWSAHDAAGDILVIFLATAISIVLAWAAFRSAARMT